MSSDFYNETYHIAQKDYNCDACELVNHASASGDDFNKIDSAIWENAVLEKYKIRKGTTYIKRVQKYCGDFTEYRARPDIEAIVIKYDLFDED